MMNACGQIGGHAAELRDEEAFKEAFNALDEERPGGQVIFGAGNDEEEEGTWVWPSDGKVFHKVDGSPNGPIAVPQRDESQNCMVSKPGHWEDGPCTIPRVICQARLVSGSPTFLDEVEPIYQEMT